MVDFSYEQAALAAGYRVIAGVDEVGRGPLAGPVMAAAVILNPDAIPDGLADSKKLTAKKREALFDPICQSALAVGLGQASSLEIDALNIRQATHLAMRRALAALAITPDFLLIDGSDKPQKLIAPCQTIIKGDSLSFSIAAASIVAKVARDRQMARLGALFPAYGFEKHAGYGTKAHLEAIRAHGATIFHRKSFAPIRFF